MKENEQDRISRYLCIGNTNMLFGELSDDFLMAMGAREILHGIPVPIGQGENGQIAVRSIFIDMAKVIGGDASFVYADKYLTYIKAAGGDNAEPMLVSEGAKAADEGRYEDACKLLRAALMVDPKSQAAQYLYGRACKACYEIAGDDEAFADDYESIGKIETDDESEFPQNVKRVGMEGLQSLAGDRQAVGNYIGNFKAESMDTFEVLTMMHPDFAMGYYFLGYAYLNMGLYLKAKLTWDEFIKLSSAADINEAGLDYDQLEDLRNEVTRMLLDLDDPVLFLPDQVRHLRFRAFPGLIPRKQQCPGAEKRQKDENADIGPGSEGHFLFLFFHFSSRSFAMQKPSVPSKDIRAHPSDMLLTVTVYPRRILQRTFPFSAAASFTSSRPGRTVACRRIPVFPFSFSAVSKSRYGPNTNPVSPVPEMST